MRYFLQAVEIGSGLPFELEISSPEEFEAKKLALVDYTDFYLHEVWSSLEEMYEAIKELEEA